MKPPMPSGITTTPKLCFNAARPRLVGERGDPPARRLRAIAVAIKLQRLPIVVLRIEADAEQVERRAGSRVAHKLQHAMKVIAEHAA